MGGGVANIIAHVFLYIISERFAYVVSLVILIAIALFGGCFYVALPLPIQLTLLLINIVVPDPIPFIDEIIMVGGVLSKLLTVEDWISDFIDWLSEHKILGTIVVIGLLWLIFQLGGWFWNMMF